MDHRENIIVLLEAIKKRDFTKNDKWKVRAYNNVIEQLKQRQEPVYSIDDLKDIKGIGQKIRQKIEEIISTGDLAQVKTIEIEVEIISDLTRIFGIGPVRARELHEKHNISSIEDLKNHTELLNDKQIMGLKYYLDFEKRIPRTEMDKHATMINNIISELDSNLLVEVMGSYRRGAKDSGDIDILITHKEDPEAYSEFMERITNALIKKKYIIDTFAKGNKKFNGVCKLPRHKFHRRLDIMYARQQEWPFALLYFTGSMDFNTKLRAIALQHKLSLNEYGFTCIEGEKKGERVDGTQFKSEEDVFHYLGIQYIPPKERQNGVVFKKL
jgi:DNA polymerase beta